MKTNKQIFLLFFILICISNGCKTEFKTPGEYLGWLNNPNNKLVLVKKINGLELKVKYLPPEYLAYKELKKDSSNNIGARDSLRNLHQNSISFLLTIGPDVDKKAEGDIMYTGVLSYEEFSERAQLLNFQMEDYVTLVTDHGRIKPALTTLENTYGLASHRNIYFLFVLPDSSKNINESGTFDFNYNDEIFNTGNNHFVFYKKDIERLPSFTF